MAPTSPLMLFIPAGIVALIGIILLGVGGNNLGGILAYHQNCAVNGFSIDDQGCCVDYSSVMSYEVNTGCVGSLAAHIAELAIGAILIVGAGIGAFCVHRKMRQTRNASATSITGTAPYSFSMQGLTGVLRPKQQYAVPQYQEQQQPLQLYQPQPEAYQPTQPVYATAAQAQQYAPPTQQYAPVGQQNQYQTAAYTSGHEEVGKHFSS